MMPFIVTTRTPTAEQIDAFCKCQGGCHSLNPREQRTHGRCRYRNHSVRRISELVVVPAQRKAVATLEEAWKAVEDHITPLFDWGDVRSSPSIVAIANVGESGGTVGPLPDGSLISVDQLPDNFDVDAFNEAQ